MTLRRRKRTTRRRRFIQPQRCGSGRADDRSEEDTGQRRRPALPWNRGPGPSTAGGHGVRRRQAGSSEAGLGDSSFLEHLPQETRRMNRGQTALDRNHLRSVEIDDRDVEGVPGRKAKARMLFSVAPNGPSAIGQKTDIPLITPTAMESSAVSNAGRRRGTPRTLSQTSARAWVLRMPRPGRGRRAITARRRR